ncbi:hypothetical protein QJS83_09435 [Bdellovibrio sp. 22V]|uniref:hypothetical protein n=1 Tax=Bdellovibrio sp. 22V TaxID=3044166 RepID=UPI0025430367|nr:hypothetical protein [Bdellovibrio sp. 22V]WII70680.1 hypothetical protein QJS83_09435 [Bdellovibrio sp. 22V]
MKKWLLLALTMVSSPSYAVLDLSQSSPSLKWYSISNDVVQVVYPESMQPESVYIANLIEHYSHVVGKTYLIDQPEKFTLILRPEMAEPNGFVTLAPRRSEWFSATNYFPLVSSTEWYQTLSIHEYRHVNQFDYYNRSTARWFYYLMGDMGRQFAVFFSLPSWYMEGDAVWTETKYTDAGRGRSPRFIARMKALVLSEKIPTYDQFVNGSYNTDLPNQYVYGYALISYATIKYGEDIWHRVLTDMAEFPHPFRLYNSFERVTGQTFEDFYVEAMNDLRQKWSKDAPGAQIAEDFREETAPFKVGDSLYFVNRTLDASSAIYKKVGNQSEKVAELNFNREIMEISVGTRFAIYTEYLPHFRYADKGYSDLVLMDLQSGARTKITSGQRLYNPSFNGAENKIIAVEFTPGQSWHIAEFDLNGKKLQSFPLAEGKALEARYTDEDHAAVLLNSRTGERSIVSVDLKQRKIVKQMVPPSRNLLTALYVDKNHNLLFEAQYKGSNEIFKLDSQGLARCTFTKLGAFTPSSDGTSFYFSNMDTYGAKISEGPLSSCESFPMDELVNFKYLGDTPSDNYNKFAPQPFPEQAELFTKNAAQYKPEEHGDFDKRLAIPHTWGIMVGRGGGLGVEADNYLRTLSWAAFSGTDAEEGQSFFNLSFDVKKYYPLFSFEVEQRNRKVEFYDTDDELAWSEKSAGLSVVLPYVKKYGLYNVTTALSLGGSYADAAEYEFNKTEIDGGNFFYKSFGQFSFVWNKDPHHRSIMEPWLLGYNIRYDKAEQPSVPQNSGDRLLQQAVLKTPGAFANDGFMFSYDQQKQESSPTAYRFQPNVALGVGSAFSRGYAYEDVPGYYKISGNYVFPWTYPDWDFGGWYYLKRLYSTVFYDSTEIDDTELPSTLNSYGAELLFESRFLRLLPITFGGRVVHTLEDNVVKGQFFLATSLTL